MSNKSNETFFNGDELATSVWSSKYRINDETNPQQMLDRISNELSKMQLKINEKISIKLNNFEVYQKLSNHGKLRFKSIVDKNLESLKKHFGCYINFDGMLPGGSGLEGIGNYKMFSTLSNCFVIDSPYDAYSGISRTGEEMVQIMKRRGGVGFDLSSIRPMFAKVNNQSKYSSGPVLFANRYSNNTREVAQNGRRGAALLSMHINHPDSLDFITVKQDLSKITGANLSVKIDDDFMQAVKNDSDYILTFPTTENIFQNLSEEWKIKLNDLNYDELYEVDEGKYIKKIKSKKYWDTIIKCAWKTAEPGILFVGNWRAYGYDSYYKEYMPISTNPCSEIPMQPYDACRLIAQNLYSLINNPFKSNASINYDKLYEYFYEQICVGDLIIDLEMIHIDLIIDKIIKDVEIPEDLKLVELNLWKKIKETCSNGRRIGAGFTGLADMLAALLLPYYSPTIVETIFRIKYIAEIDASTDLGILLGTFKGFDKSKENLNLFNKQINVFLDTEKFDLKYSIGRMLEYGRRNISFSTAAPTGSLSILTQTTSGIEPLFLPWYKRRKKIIGEIDLNTLTEFERNSIYVDPADGNKFEEYFVLHPKFKTWLMINGKDSDKMYEEELQTYFEKSPWFGNCANDLNWKHRIEIQSIIQKYTTHAISSTINLPADIDEEIVSKIYMHAWERGLKGITVYRDGSRGGVLVSTNSEQKENIKIEKEFDDSTFETLRAPKRPTRLKAKYHNFWVKSKKINRNYDMYSVVIGFMNDRPYEIFIISNSEDIPDVFDTELIEHGIDGYIIKEYDDFYSFECDLFEIPNLTEVEHEEKEFSILISMALRHRTPLKKIIKGLDKSEPIAGTFTNRIIKILSKYLTNDITKEVCPACKAKEVIPENGCAICKSCGWTKC